MSETMTLTTVGPWGERLLEPIHRLDCRYGKARDTFKSTALDAAGDAYRGLYFSQADVEQLLARPPGTPTLRANGAASAQPLLDARSYPPPRWTSARDGR